MSKLGAADEQGRENAKEDGVMVKDAGAAGAGAAGAGDGFAQRLAALRKKDGRSRFALAQLCGLHDTAIREYELGMRRPSLDGVEKIADYFGVSVDYLLGRNL